MADYKRLPMPFDPAVPYFEEYRNGSGIDPNGPIVYQSRRLTVRDGPAILSSGMPVPDFTSYVRGSAVTVVPWHPGTHQLVMIRKIKTASGIAYYTFPAGMLPTEQSPERVARDELREEAGLETEGLVYLSYTGRRPESSTDIEHLFLAFVKTLNGLHGDEEEGVTTKAVSLERALTLAMTQQVEEPSAVALWRALPHLGNWPRVERTIGRAIVAARKAAGIMPAK